MTSVNVSNPQTVTVVRPAARGPHGDPGGPAVRTDVSGCVIWPEASTEQTFQQDIVALGYQVLAPPGTDVQATDQLEWDDTTYEVAGQPETFQSPWSNTDPGVLITIRRNQ